MDGALKFFSSLNTAGFESGAKRMQQSADTVSAGVKNAFAGVARAVVAIGGAFLAVRASADAFNKALDLGGKLNDLSARPGESAGNLAILQRAFENAGLGADQVGSMLDRMSRYMVESTKAGSEQQKTLAALGLSFDSLQGKTPTQQLQALASAVSSVEDPAIRTKVAMEIFGRSGGELMPLLRAMGSELDIARQQLGSLPSVMDKSAEAFDKLGDSLAAIGNKGTELAAGILEKLAPALASVAERVAAIDATGLGKALGEYAVQTAKWVAETLKVSEAITAVKTAIAGIAVGEVCKGFELLFTTAKIAGLNAVNEVVAAAMAAVESVGAALQSLFGSDSTTMAFINGSFEMLGAKIASNISKHLADVLEQIPFMGAAAEAIRATQKEAEQAVQDISNIMYYEADNLKKEWGGIMAEMPKRFAESYEQNARSPLFDLTNELAKQKELSAELASNIRAAGISAGDFSNALNNSPLRGGSLMDRLTGGDADSPFPDTTRGGGAKIPIKIDPAALASSEKEGGGTSAKSQTTSALDALRKAAETDARARADLFRIEAEMSRRTSRVPELMDKGQFGSAATTELRAERNAERRAQDIMSRRSATDLLFGEDSPLKNMGDLEQQFRRQNPFGRREDFDRFVRDQSKTQAERVRESTQGGGTGGKDAKPQADPMSGMASDIAQIKEVLIRADGIHDRLPIRALSAA